MTIESVAVTQSVGEAPHNQVFAHVNSAKRVIFETVGTFSWQVPSGVHAFKVTLCGGGGNAGADFSGDQTFAGGKGGNARMVSRWFTGYDIGSTFQIQVAPAGNPAAISQFGAGLLVSNSGAAGIAATLSGPGTAGAAGAQSNAQMQHGNEIFVRLSTGRPFGAGGKSAVGEVDGGLSPEQGIVVIEW